MSRPLRIEFPGAVYHVMNRGRNRQKIFQYDLDYQMFLNLLGETHRMWGIRIWAYSLLPNHYHLLLETPRGNLSRSLRHLDGIYTQRYNRVHSTEGSLFRGRYKAILVGGESYLLQVLRYIHLNPVEAKIVKDPVQHPWTSHRYFLGAKDGVPGLAIDHVMRCFHSDGKRAVKYYQKFMAEGVDQETQRIYKRGNLPSTYGSEAFREKIKKMIKRMGLRYEIPDVKRESGRPNLGEIEEEVCRVYGVERKYLKGIHRGFWNEPRNVAIYLGRMMGGYKLGEIGDRWGGNKI